MPAELEGTYKAREVEGFFDLLFYRRVGFALARLFAALRISPAAVTVLSGLFGIVAGHLYFYRVLSINIVGMALHVTANALDNADGQLARLTNTGSRFGRALDGVADNLVFLSIYLHLCLRHIAAGGSDAVFVLAAAAAASHSIQSAVADYCRNGYLYFVKGRSRSELESSAVVRAKRYELTWQREPGKKFLLTVYLNYTRQQEIILPSLKRLQSAAAAAFPREIPPWLTMQYCDGARPIIRWLGAMMTNFRMAILFILLILARPIWYFVVELTVLNVVVFYVVSRQRSLCRSLLRTVANRSNSAGVASSCSV